MSHIGNYDIRVMTVATVLVGLVALLSDLFLRFTFMGAGHRRGSRDKGGGAAVVLLLVALVGAILAPIVAQAIRMAVEKIAADPEPLEAANKATAHMYIYNPLREHASFLNNMFNTHPPVQERIRLLRSM